MKVGPDQFLALDHCLNCKCQLDACSVINDDGSEEVPNDGDITICVYCGHVMAFDHQARLREMTDGEARAVAGDARLLAISRAIAEARKSHVN